MLADAQQIRAIQAEIAGRAATDLNGLFTLAGGLDPSEARDLLLEAVPPIAVTHGQVNAAAAGEWYADLRAREIGSGIAPHIAPPVELARVQGAVRFSALHLFDGQPDLMLAYLTGELFKWVAQPARQTIIDTTDADPLAAGWQRVTRPTACGFCRMLADRGGVYKRASVDFAAHRSCNCGAVPSWDPGAREVSARAYQASERMEKVRRRAEDPTDPKKQAQAQAVLDRHRARVRDWISAFDS